MNYRNRHVVVLGLKTDSNNSAAVFVHLLSICSTSMAPIVLQRVRYPYTWCKCTGMLLKREVRQYKCGIISYVAEHEAKGRSDWVAERVLSSACSRNNETPTRAVYQI